MRIENHVEQLIDKLVEAESKAVTAALEKRINALEADKIEVSEKIAQCGRPLRGFDETLRTALHYLGNPGKYWASERFEAKKTVLKLTFSERLAYTRNSGFRTAELSLPFKALAGVSGGARQGQMKMARPTGESSNPPVDLDQLFATLAEWNTELERLSAAPAPEPSP